MAELASPKRVVGVQIAPGLPVPCAPVLALSSKHAVHNWTMLVQIQSGVLLLS